METITKNFIASICLQREQALNRVAQVEAELAVALTSLEKAKREVAELRTPKAPVPNTDGANSCAFEDQTR